MVNLYYVRLPEFPDTSLPFSSQKDVCEKVRREKGTGKILLHYVLVRVFHWKAEAIQLHINEHGKPYLNTDRPVFFNISHSGDYVVCAFSDTEIGVDIQKIGKIRMPVAERFFHPRETRILMNTPDREKDELFFRYWSGKESFLKYTGTGLSASLASFCIVWGKRETEIYKSNVRLPLFLHECEVDGGYKCFVCSEQAASPEVIQLSWEEIRDESI